jgi:SNF2 family DNA or RNA helicase
MRAFCELSPNGRRIEVFFPYDPNAVESIKEVPGRRFHDIQRDGRKLKFWSVPADMDSAKRLRDAFGQGLTLGDGVKQWGLEQVRVERNIAKFKHGDDAELERVPEEFASWLRPYQRADAAHMAIQNAINANQPGVGKTVETICAIVESGAEGPHLVICPTSLFKDPWRDELAAHLPSHKVIWGATPDARRKAIQDVWDEYWGDEEDFTPERYKGLASKTILLVNPEMVRAKPLAEDDGETMFEDGTPRRHLFRPMGTKNIVVPADSAAAKLFGIEWGWVIADEFHKYGLGADRNTQFSRGLAHLAQHSKHRAALSGTPTGGKPIRLFGPLNFIDPEKFSSKWRWAEMWLTNAEGGPVVAGAGTGIGGMAPGREQEFNEAHSRYLIRRTRADALPGMPPKQIINVPCPMTPKQRKVYDAFVSNAEVEVEGGRISGNGILSEYAKAKQLANAMCLIDADGKLQPTEESGKLAILLDRLDSYGFRKTDPEPGVRAIVASESQRFVAFLEGYLGDALRGCVSVARLDGTVKGERRDAVIDWYKEKSDDPRILVMTTQTGGVGLNLGMTQSIHIMDETWSPDDQEQLEDRGMRNRTTPLICLYYRTEDSIQEYVWEVTQGKKVANKKLLDSRKKWAK